MEIGVTEEFRGLCEKILAEKKTEEQWAEVESDDMFQSTAFSGGFDADEMAFCFSYYDENRSEFWFQLTLRELGEIAAGRKQTLQVRSPD